MLTNNFQIKYYKLLKLQNKQILNGIQQLTWKVSFDLMYLFPSILDQSKTINDARLSNNIVNIHFYKWVRAK